MRVVHICGDLGLYGAENVVALLMRHTDERDVELAVMTVNRSEHPEARERVGVPVIAIERGGRKDVGFLARMIRELRRIRPQVVHTHGHHGRYWGRLAAVAARVPVIVHTEHNSDLIAPSPRLVFDGLNRLLRERTAAFIAFTEGQRDRLARAEGIPAARVEVIPNGVPAHPPDPHARARGRAALGVEPGELALVVVGRLFEPKRLDIAIDALAELPPALRDRSRLLLTGDGPLREALAAQAAARGLGERVRFLGFRTDVRDLLAGADVALLTSAREAMPLALIEAMLEGAPIVSTPWAGAELMLGGGRFGRIARELTPGAVADALRETLENPAAAAARAADARAYARDEFDVAKQARRYAALYRRLSARTRAASSVMTAERS
jgi:L-malate glycosyltransferase